MTNAWFLGARTSVGQTEDEVRATTEPVRTDGPAEQDNPRDVSGDPSGPDWNERESDVSGQLTGLAPRMLASDTVDSQQYSPWWSRLANENHNKIVDDQVSTSGTAAARESIGEQGHGTMQFALGIEPVIREGAAFGADYFKSHEMDVQDGSGIYMAPPTGISSRWGTQVNAAYAQQRSRQAYQSSLYDALLNG